MEAEAPRDKAAAERQWQLQRASKLLISAAGLHAGKLFS